MDKRTVQQILVMLSNQYSDLPPSHDDSATRRDELDIAVDSIRQLAGEWVSDYWYDLRKGRG